MQERRYIPIKMKSLKAKAKTKKPNGKFGKVKFSAKEVAPANPDLSQLNQQVDTSVSSLYSLRRVLEDGSDEIKSILAYECDLVYECRICRSLFRSLVNLISHKRIYCKEKFDVTFGRSSSDNHDSIFTIEPNTQILETTHQEGCGNDRILRSQVSKEEQKKDLISVVNMLQKKQNESLHSNTEHLCLEVVQSNSSAVYQTLKPVVSTQNHVDLMKAQVTELKDMINERTAVLGPDGQILQSKHDSITSNNEETTCISEPELTCSICNAKFSTKKTLAVHTRTLHTSHRLCYPCPYCPSTFANTWSVYRHLFKVHRKTNDHVRKLRVQIQEKAFIKDTTGAEDLQKEQASKALAASLLPVNETQEWIDHLESDAELYRCGGCGKRFERKAALSSHSQYCHRRVAACESTTKIKKVNKVLPDQVSNETIVTSTSTEINNSNETSIRVEAVSTLSKADWEMLQNTEVINEKESKENITMIENRVQEDIAKNNSSATNTASDSLEIVYANMGKHKNNVGSRKRKNKDSAKRITPDEGNAEKMDHALIMEKKIAALVSFQKLQCLPCKRKFTSVTNLRRHAAIHVGWNRYRCKICNYKCFVKCDCVAHCNKIHNAQNNRAIIEDMISQISDDNIISEQEIILKGTNLEEETNNPDVVEISVPLNRVKQEEIQLEEIDEDQVVTEIANEKINTEIENETEVKGQTEEDVEVITETRSKVNAELKNETDIEIIPSKPAACQEIVNGDAQEDISNGVKGQNPHELDPELRKMVMEVIFGSSETNSTKQVVEKEKSPTSFDAKESEIVCLSDNPRPQRPTRNKIKPLNKDFIYDLKEVTLRKESLIVKPFGKILAKRTSSQEESTEKDSEPKSKRIKPLSENGVSIHCESNVMDKCDVKFGRERLNDGLSFFFNSR
ncbi:zinc finger protein 800 isoform X1 [Megalopta genalis]|uniref:zinc finger protein 800 isoform X1 n=2 Tax=Megalopta genalis TaxID=115081 RepID=UPI003FCF643D